MSVVTLHLEKQQHPLWWSSLKALSLLRVQSLISYSGQGNTCRLGLAGSHSPSVPLVPGASNSSVLLCARNEMRACSVTHRHFIHCFSIKPVDISKVDRRSLNPSAVESGGHTVLVLTR